MVAVKLFMARIERTTGNPEGMGEIKGQLKKVSKRLNRRNPLFSCFFIVLIVIFLILLWLAWMLSSTGLVRIPVFSALAYNKPVPEHLVSPGISVGEVIEKTFRQEVTERLQAGDGELVEKNIQLSLSEENLTASLQEEIRVNGETFFDSSGAQVVLSSGGQVEIYIPFTDSELETAIIVTLKPIVNNGKLDVEIQKMKIGSLTIPKGIAEKSFLDGDLPTALFGDSSSYEGIVSFEEISVQEGILRLGGVLEVEVERL